MVTINVSFVPYLRVVMYFIGHLSARRLAITKLLPLFPFVLIYIVHNAPVSDNRLGK